MKKFFNYKGVYYLIVGLHYRPDNRTIFAVEFMKDGDRVMRVI